MWVIVSFDLPVENTEQRRIYTQFRKKILEGNGFFPLQKSVYYRWCFSAEHAETIVGRVQEACPKNGSVFVLHFSEQIGNNSIYIKNDEENRLLERPMPFELF